MRHPLAPSFSYSESLPGAQSGTFASASDSVAKPSSAVAASRFTALPLQEGVMLAARATFASRLFIVTPFGHRPSPQSMSGSDATTYRKTLASSEGLEAIPLSAYFHCHTAQGPSSQM